MIRPINILLLNGIAVHGDAISRSLVLKREALLEAYGERVNVSIAVYASNLDLPDTYKVSGLIDLLGNRAFQEADLLIYEFGIYYEFFDSVRLTSPEVKRLAVWHNVTPPALATSKPTATLLERSLDQRSNLLACDHIFCDSEFNANELRPLHPNPGQVSVLKLPVSAAFAGVGAKPRSDTGDVRVLYVGRIVPAKGVLDLVRAFIAAARLSPGSRPKLVIIGNIDLSLQPYMNEVRSLAQDSGDLIDFIGHINEIDLIEQYRRADILVIPSYHEGYCIPVIEAFSSGCHVIAYDAGNLPYIVGECGLILPTGDVDGLRDALAAEFHERKTAAKEGRPPLVATVKGPVNELARRDAARRYAADYSEGAFREQFISAVERLYGRTFGVHQQ